METISSTTQALNESNCLEALDSVQSEIARRVILNDSTADITSIAAVGHSFCGDNVLSYVVTLDSDMQLIEEATATYKIQTPYIPGLLFCREGPSIIEAVRNLRRTTYSPHKTEVHFVVLAPPIVSENTIRPNRRC